MAVFLLDVNVLMALAWPNHQLRQAAKAWFSALGSDQWATCPITQCGLVRISSNPKSMPDALSPREAIKLLEDMVAHPKHVFWEDTIALATSPFIPRQTIQGHQQITDAYLLGLSLSHGGLIATFDEGMPSLARTSDERAAIVLIPK